MRKKKLGWMVGSVAALGLVVWGVRQRATRSQDHETEEVTSPQPGAPQVVNLFEVTKSTFSDAIEGLIGTVKGDTIELTYPGPEEPLTAVRVKVGQKVSRGDVLFEVDHQRARARLDQAEAAYQRGRELFQAGASTALDVRESKSAYDLARRDYEDTFVRAPKSGSISDVNKQVGETVGRNTPLGMLVSNQDKLVLETGVVEGQLERVAVGQGVEVVVDALSADTIPGRVVGVSREVTTTGRTGAVMVELPAQVQSKLRPGLSARCRILTFSGESLFIPRQALQKTPEKIQVFVAREGKAVATTVKLGYHAPDFDQVLEGLRVGDLIVRDLVVQPVQDGAAITPAGIPERLGVAPPQP